MVERQTVQKRIDEVKIGLEQNKKLSEDRIKQESPMIRNTARTGSAKESAKQERDSVIPSKRKIETELADARSEVNLLKEQQKKIPQP